MSQTIFVQIPAYKDLQVIATIQDLFDKAADKSRISVGVCWQYATPLPATLNLGEWKNQLRVKAVKAEQSQGVGWAKSQVQALHQGERYVLQIDCHTRFAKDWDSRLLRDLQLCPHNKPVLSAYPQGFSLNDGSVHLKQSARTFRYPQRFDENGVLKLASQSFEPQASHLTQTPFVTPRFIFAEAGFISEVAADPSIYFDEEELDLSLRAWMDGWQVYIPAVIPLWHLYNSDGSKRPVHWKTNENWRASRKQSCDAIRSLLELPYFGDRDLASFESYTGISFEQSRVQLPRQQPNYASDLAGVYPAAKSLWEGLNDPPATLIPDTKPLDNAEPLCQLGVGDTLPHICFPNLNGRHGSIEVYGGEYLLIHLFSAQPDLSVETFAEHARQWRVRAQGKNISQICIYQGSAEEFKTSNLRTINASWWMDHQARLLQIIVGAQHSPLGLSSIFLSPNCKILDIITGDDIERHLVPPLDRVVALNQAETRILDFHPPVMVIENVLNSLLIDEVIHYWQAGKQFAGAVGAGSDSQVKNEKKRRTDVLVVDRRLTLELDQAFAINLLPELKKITGYDLSYRELYKIGCYFGDQLGLFKKHRDTGLVSLSFRRYAVSLMLSDDYEGGALIFPEYGSVGYKVKAGSAIVFPAPLMHEVNPVTRGERYTLVTFLFDEQNAAFRSCYRQYENKEDETSLSRFTTARHHENLPIRPIATRNITSAEVTREEFESLIQDVKV